MTDSMRPLEDELEIDRVCMAYEDAFRAGSAPSIAAALSEAPGHLRGELTAELAALRAELEATSHPSVHLEGSPSSPTRIGRYEVGEVLGQGGMGTVYEAVQDQPRRRVALKVIRTDRVSAKEVRRFRREAGVLGHLHHPCIAQVYEAGTARPTEGGPELPYLVMEHVQGLPLLDHAAERGLGLRERLTLLFRVCAAVQHAHDQGVVHRDLKPANILVRELTSSARIGSGDAVSLGQPVVLDFGLARATGLMGLDSMETRVGQIVGTLSHMAPEQVEGLQDRVDGRADVYSLGVVLYELVGGRLPLQLSGKTLPEAIDAIRTTEPRPLGELDPKLRGDVEIVCRKALEKDQARRYSTPAEFGADLQRVLDQEPIRARPPSAAYQMAKFAKRNPVIVSALAAAAMTLVVALGVVLVYAVREGRLRASAEAERDKVAAVGAFQARVIGSANLEEGGRPRETTLLEAIRNAADGVDDAFPDAPEVEAAIRVQLGHAFLSLSELPAAELHFQRALELLQERHGEEHPETLRALIGVQRSVEADHRFEEAHALARRTAKLAEKLYGERGEKTLKALNNLATVLDSLGEYEEAVSIHRRVLRLREEIFGPDSNAVSLSLNNLASVLEVMGELEKAEGYYRRCLALRRELYESPHKLLGNIINNLGVLCIRRGKLDEARPLLEETLAMRERLFGPGHPELAATLTNMGVLENMSGNPALAADLMERALKIHDRHYGEGHAGGDVYRSNVVILRRQAGQHQESLDLQIRNLALLRGNLGDDHEKTLRGVNVLVQCRVAMGDLDEAEQLAKQNLTDVRRALPECRLTAECLESLAGIAAHRGLHAEGVAYAAEAVQVHRRLDKDHPSTFDAELLLAKATYASGEKATGRAIAQDLLIRSRDILGDGHTYTKNIQTFLDQTL